MQSTDPEKQPLACDPSSDSPLYSDCESGNSSSSDGCNPVEGCPCAPTRQRAYESDWTVHAKRTRMLSQDSQSCGILVFTILMLVLCIVSFVFCQECLFGLLIISACLCPFFHPLNAPLWLAIVLLTVGGWSFTAGALSVTWDSKNH